MRKFLNEAGLKLEDIFEVDTKAKILKGIKNEDLLKKVKGNFKKDEQGNLYYHGAKDVDYKLDDSVKKTVVKHFPDLDVDGDDGKDSGDADTDDGKPSGFAVSDNKLETLGVSIVYGILLGPDMDPGKRWSDSEGTGRTDTTKTKLSPEELQKNLSLETLKEKINLLFADDVDFSDNYFKDMTVGEFIEDLARRDAYYNAKRKKKLKNDVEYVKGEGKDAEYDSIIDTDDATKNLYEKAYNRLTAAFAEGVKKGSETVQKGGKIQDPITKKTCDVKPSVLAQIKTGIADMMSAAGDIAKDLLGLNKNDIFSRMIRYAIGGKKISDILRTGSRGFVKEGRKIKNKDVKKHNEEALRTVNEALKQNNLPKDDKDKSPATEAVKKAVEENMRNIVCKLGIIAALLESAEGKSLFSIIGEEKNFLLSPVNGKDGLSQVEDQRRLLDEAIAIYNDFYKKAISKSKVWKALKVQEQKIAVNIKWNMGVFDVVTADDFKTEPDVSQQIDAVKKFYESLRDPKFDAPSLSDKTNEKFSATVIELKKILEGNEIAQFKDVKFVGEKLPDETPGLVIADVPDQKEKEEGESPVPEKIEQHVKTTGEKISEIIANIDKDGVEQQLEKIKNMASQTEKEMEAFMSQKDDNGNETAGKASFDKEWNGLENLMKDFGSDPFATIWQYHYLMSKKYESVFNKIFNRNMLLNLLFESEEGQPENGAPAGGSEQPAEGEGDDKAKQEEANKKQEFINSVKEAIQKLPELFKMQKPEDFVRSYGEFAKSINEKIKTVLEGENTSDETKKQLEGLKDATIFERAIKFYKTISAKEEEKPEEEKSEGEAEGQGEDEAAAAAENDTKQGGQEKIEDSFVPKLFLTGFRKYLKESLK